MDVELDQWVSPGIRTAVEQEFYARVNNQAGFDRLRQDPTFFPRAATGSHPGLFADHGVVHVRDVATRIVEVLERVHGLLIPERPAPRFTRMQGYGVLLAYFHDIGMVDFSLFGRTMHPEVATQLVFSRKLDPVIDAIWQENSAGLPTHLTHLAASGALRQPPNTVLRELLALAIGHSKSKIPTDLINHPPALRERLIETLSCDLHYLYDRRCVRTTEAALLAAQHSHQSEAVIEQCYKAWQQAMDALDAYGPVPPLPELLLHQHPLPDTAFHWLVDDNPPARELVADALDTVRALRAADALRQRGDTLKTSGGYEVFVNQRTANAVYALSASDSDLYLLEIADPVSAGEANIASSELDSDGNLRIAFHRGAFAGVGATDYAVASAARVIEDIQRDVMESFQYPADDPDRVCSRQATGMRLLLEETDDSVEFASRVREQLIAMRPDLHGRIATLPSLHQTSEHERVLYLSAMAVPWSVAERREFLNRLQQSGHRTEMIDANRAFQDVHLVSLQPGDVLVDAGAPSAFVYVPLESGLRILPLGGYEALSARAWVPLGVTGVIRGAQRNATVVAEAPVRLLMIPKGVYLREWHATHSPESLQAVLGDDDPLI